MSKKEYWYVYDLETRQYLHSGRRVPTLKRAINEVWSLWFNTTELEERDLKMIKKWDLKTKKKWLESLGYKFEKHKGKLGDVV